MLTVVILLAFLSMSEALSRQGYLLVPDKAETADPAHSPYPVADGVCMCVCDVVCYLGVSVCVCNVLCDCECEYV